MQKLLKEIKSDVQALIRGGDEPQAVYQQVCEKYCVNEKDRRFLKKFIAKKVKHTVIPENRREFGFSYHLFRIALWVAVVITIFSKQHRLEALGINSLSSVSLLGGFIFFNFFAWIYLYLAIRSMRFNLSVSYQALLIAMVDVVRLLIVFPIYWTEAPVSSVLRLFPPLLIILFGSFYVLNCSNPFTKNKNGEVIFYKIKKKYHLGQHN